MGLFSSKKKTYVATEVSRVFSNGDIPTLRKKNVIDSVINNKRLTNAMVNNALDSFALKAERAYRKAARGDYYYGVPSRSILNSGDGKDILQNILETEHQAPIQFNYFHFAPINNLHYAWQTLVDDYGYDEFSNSLVLDGHTYWVENVEGTVNTTAITADATAETKQEMAPDAGTLSIWDRHPQDRYTPHRTGAEKTPVWVFGTDVEDGALVHLVDQHGNQEKLVVSTSSFDRDLECFQAKYRYQANGKTVIRYFTHEYGAPEHPQLNTVHDNQATGTGTFFPVFVFRSKGRNLGDDKGSAAYESSVKLARSMDLDYEYMAEKIDENPDGKDLEQAVLMMGVPAQTDNDAEAEYLYRFFDWIYKDSDSGSNYATGSLDQDRPGRAIEIKERDFNTTLSFSRISRSHKNGRFGKPGTYRCVRGSVTKHYRIWRSSGGSGPAQMTTIPYTVEALKYQKQVTENTYQEVAVEGLKVRYHIYGDKGVTANVGSDKLLVPVDYYIAREMRYDKKEWVYHSSLHFVFNSKVTVRVKWYQTGIFQIVMIVIAVVITIVTAGAGSPLGAALAAGAYGTAALLIIQSIVVNMVIGRAIQEIAKVVIEELGIDAGIVVAIAAAIAAIYGAATNASWANTAMMASSNIGTATQKQMQDVMKDYRAESQEFALMTEEKLEELEEVENLLNTYDLLDPRSFIGQEPYLIVGESPTNLYDRTVHAGNPGTLAYDYIESYVDINTQLPTFDELVGRTFV